MALEEHTADVGFNVSGLLREPVGAKRTYTLSELALRLDADSQATDIEGTVELLRIRTGILAQGRVAADVPIECARCLTETRTRVETDLEEEFRPSLDPRTGTVVQAVQNGEHEDDFSLISPNHILDLTEPIRQSLVVATPYSPLCREDCAGLCPICGADLNEVGHSCAQPVGDRRLAGLAVLLDQMD